MTDTRVQAVTRHATHVVSVGVQGPSGPIGPEGPRGPAFEAGDVVALEFGGSRATLEYANGDANEFDVRGTINGGSF